MCGIILSFTDIHDNNFSFVSPFSQYVITTAVWLHPLSLWPTNSMLPTLLIA